MHTRQFTIATFARKKLGIVLIGVSSIAVANTTAAQGSGIINMSQTANGSCTLEPSPYYATCVLDSNGRVTRFANSSFVTASAEVGGALHAGSSIIYTNGSGTSQVTTIARAGYYNALTITSLSQPTFMSFSLSAQGFTGSSQSAPARENYGIYNIWNFGDQEMPDSYFLNSPMVSRGDKQFKVLGNIGVVNDVITLPVFLGINNIMFTFSAVSFLDRPADIPTGNWSGSSYSDYMNTASITGFKFVDANGLDISSSVDAGFATTMQVVPEPSTVLLMGAGLIGLFAASRRRRRSPQI